MVMAKQKMKEIIEAPPDDASYEEIIREFAFERMVERGLDDVRNDRIISDEEMRRRIRTWQGYDEQLRRKLHKCNFRFQKRQLNSDEKRRWGYEEQ